MPHGMPPRSGTRNARLAAVLISGHRSAFLASDRLHATAMEGGDPTSGEARQPGRRVRQGGVPEQPPLSPWWCGEREPAQISVVCNPNFLLPANSP